MILFGVNTGKSNEPSTDNIWKGSLIIKKFDQL
jgi:hypothetical protein